MVLPTLKEFFNKLYFGGHLNNDDKGELNSVNELQRSGFELDFNFGTQFFLNEEKWYVNFQNIITSAGKYEQGLFDLIFRGNTRLNKEISLSKTAFHYRNHHLFHFGKYFNFGSVGFTLGSINQEYNIKFKEGDNLNLMTHTIGKFWGILIFYLLKIQLIFYKKMEIV